MKTQFRKGLGKILPPFFILAGALIGALGSGDSHAQSPLAFGIQPTQETQPGADRRPYFSFTLEPNADAQDSVSVTNNGADPVTLKLYGADGITSINGSTAFAGETEIRNNVRSWLSANVSNLEVPAGDSLVVPFSVHVPANALPGDYVAGWVAEAPPRAGDSAGVGASIVERAGVAVVVSVPGAVQQQLELGQICLNQETGSNYFEVPVRNGGNVLTKGEGQLLLQTKSGEDVFTRAAELGSVVPQDSTFLRLDAPLDPGPGDYVASIGLTLPDGSVVNASSEIEIGDNKVNGCTALAQEQEEPQSGIPYLGELPGGGTPWILILALLALLFALVAGREFVLRRRTRSLSQAGIPPSTRYTPEFDDDEVT